MTTVAIVYHSVSGRTRALADAVARGAGSVADTQTQVFSVANVDHAALQAADAIVFGCPTYMGSASGAFKSFMDGTSAIWALQAWRDKLAAAFTHSAAPSGDKLATLMQLSVFAAQHGMVWVGLGLPPTYAAPEPVATDTNRLGSHLGAMAQTPPGRTLDESDVRTAEHLGRRVAQAAQRWKLAETPRSEIARHAATNTWVFPKASRPALPAPLSRINLREIVARPERFEHHLIVCATIGRVQLEIVTASEPLYFGHVNLSDEYAIPLPCGDDLVDRFPLRTFLSDAASGADVGRYNHRNSDLVLHPIGYLHWPGRLRPPYEPFELPPGVRRCGISLVFCANQHTPSSAPRRGAPSGRDGDIKPYATPAPPMMIAAVSGEPGVVAKIGTASFELVDRPTAIAPARGGWVVIVEAAPTSAHAACDLIRIPAGASLDTTGVVRAFVLSDTDASPDEAPPSWRGLPPSPFAPFEDAARGNLPLHHGELAVEHASPTEVTIRVRDTVTTVPRYWLARMLFRVALHGLRLGYLETYGGLFIDDDAAGRDFQLGIRTPSGKTAITVPASDALAMIERLYRAVAPDGYRERLL
ncbi:MAG TPA: flavodoxin family protein [Kofleriaceae bacterium]|nr:flavodoxin family protein [Kofleriaceae bacterium]